MSTHSVGSVTNSSSSVSGSFNQPLNGHERAICLTGVGSTDSSTGSVFTAVVLYEIARANSEVSSNVGPLASPSSASSICKGSSA
jgi:hypothetical protein